MQDDFWKQFEQEPRVVRRVEITPEQKPCGRKFYSPLDLICGVFGLIKRTVIFLYAIFFWSIVALITFTLLLVALKYG
ncbi:hypothetical protein Pan258_01660 [Symmachiella dynata]|uniref:hypothetical protein n=1 Tax=Symmachiella dynata TaxID=2527995 RepID=UPI00118C6151|nr:hypothetical protein [Symmachiella dynata]QDT46149.1 hypothetical protein Pan258_01660 [Symmachiella dynata]